jgi:hypothetical protein
MDPKQLRAKAQEVGNRALAIMEAAQAEGRGLTPDERGQVDECKAQLGRYKAQLDTYAIGQQIGAPAETHVGGGAPGGWGQVAEGIAQKGMRHMEVHTEDLLRTKAVTANNVIPNVAGLEATTG